MDQAPVLDQRTASAIREAMAAVSSGRLEDARRIGEEALNNGGDATALNAMLGTLHLRSGNAEAGVRHLHAAHQSKPTDFVIAANLATALSSLGDFGAALNVASEELSKTDKSLRLARIRGFAAQQQQDYATAIAAYGDVVAAFPDDWEIWNNLGNARVSGGDLEGGVAALRRACELNPQAAPTRLNYCRALRDSGDLAEAEAQLERMAAEFPNDAKPLMDLYGVRTTLGEDDSELLKIIHEASLREPDDLELKLALARHHVQMFAMEEAEQIFRAVLEADPANEDAFIGLMEIAETSRPALLHELGEQAQAAGVGSATLNLIRAHACRRSKDYSQGLSYLADVPLDFEPARTAHVEGQLRDATGDYDGAFVAFERMNETLARDESRPLQRAALLRREQQQKIAATTEQWLDSWRVPATEPARPCPAFLVGFPRSGTTLLDTMLMGHPDVVVMEERPVVARLEQEIGGFEAIPTMDDAQLADAQERYFAIASDYAELRDGALLVDKSPLLLNRAALIHRLFPSAKFILALRHPADVVLSCFMTGFRLNSSMANFLRLDTSAEFYDLTFRGWENARSLLPLDVETIRYEDLLEDHEGELKRIVSALGLPWHDDVLDHTSTAEARGLIRTASYAQVTQPIYASAKGRWLRYRRHLEPVLPVLKPWTEKFGYSL